MDKTFKIEIARRPWYEWLAWLVWLLLVVFTWQNAQASGIENEPGASTILWVTEAILLIAGAIVYYLRRQRLTV